MHPRPYIITAPGTHRDCTPRDHRAANLSRRFRLAQWLGRWATNRKAA